MKRKKLPLIDEMVLSNLTTLSEQISYTDWIRILRTNLRMTQAELAKRAGITQPHLAGIEKRKIDPNVNTLRKIFEGLSCHMNINPQPKKEIKKILHERAQEIALKRLQHATGTMALEGQAPDKKTFHRLLKMKTDEILNDPREHLWKEDE